MMPNGQPEPSSQLPALPSTTRAGSAVPLSAVPVWAPNPAVPLPARILADLFGGMTLLAVVLSMMIPRSPDTPPLTKNWTYYHSNYGCSFPYPADWDMHAESKDDTDKVILALMPDSSVQAYAIIRQFPVEINDKMLQKAANGMVDSLSTQKGISDFTGRDEEKISDAADAERSFTFTGNEIHNNKMAGTLTLRADHQTLFILIAISPAEGWGNMRQIAGYMLENAKFE